jgi:hypothetical protein
MASVAVKHQNAVVGSGTGTQAAKCAIVEAEDCFIVLKAPEA